MLKELNVTVRKPHVLQLDNMSVINLAMDVILHDRSKHIEVKFHFLREHAAHGKIEVRHCSSESRLLISSPKN